MMKSTCVSRYFFCGGAVEAARRAAEQAEQERLRAAQEAMKGMLQYWKDALSEIQRAFKESQDALKFQFEQGGISSGEYYTRKFQDEIDYKQKESDNLAARINIVATGEFADEAQRQNQLNPLLAEKALAARDKQELLAGFNEMQQAMADLFTGENLPNNKVFQSREAYAAVKSHQKEREPIY